MTALIKWWTSNDGKRQCDARCYDAPPRADFTESECECICQGKNHGVGKARAIQRTRALAHSWVEIYPGITAWTVAPLIAFRKPDYAKDDPRYFPSITKNKRYGQA